MELLLLVVAAIVVLVILAVLLVGVVLKLLWWALIGLALGALARLILLGEQPIGWLATAAAGIAGAFLGGILGHLFGWGTLGQLLLALGIALPGVAGLSTRHRALA